MNIFLRYSLAISVCLLAGTACGLGDAPVESDGTKVENLNVTQGETAVDLDAAILDTAEAIVRAINVQRAEAGTPALIPEARLADIANLRSTDMTVRSYTGHDDPETGRTILEDLLAQTGYAGPSAELIYAARDPLDSVPDRVIEAWLNDPMHKALLLEPSFRYCGIGLQGDGMWWKLTLILTVDLPKEGVS
jgi:uncharacterized protein YkwD